MIQNKKGCLRQFDLAVYPVQIVVAVGDVVEAINERYIPYDSKYNYIDFPKEENPAATYNIKDKENSDVCLMTWFTDINDCRGSYMAHECGHAALEIFKYVGAHIDYDNQEPFCYLLGTIMRFVNQTLYEYKEYLNKNYPEEQELKFI